MVSVILQKYQPERTCVGCFKHFAQSKLLATTRLKDGTVIFDPEKKADGRSVYLCKNKICFDRAFKRKGKNAFEYGLKVQIPIELVNKLQNYILTN